MDVEENLAVVRVLEEGRGGRIDFTDYLLPGLRSKEVTTEPCTLWSLSFIYPIALQSLIGNCHFGPLMR